jgi:hypothetical protein
MPAATPAAAATTTAIATTTGPTASRKNNWHGREVRARDGAIILWLTILFVLGVNLPLGYRIYVGII